MKTFLIIMLAVLWVGYKAYKGVRKTFADPEETVGTPTFSHDETAEEPENPFVYEYEEEPSTFEEEEKAAGYYTYETTEAPAAQPETPRVAAMVAEVPEVESEQPFDLRQAVIYQTILHNKYNPGLSLA